MRWLWALTVLTACGGVPDVPLQQSDVPGLLRNPTAPLASQTDVTADRLSGEWFIRQGAYGQRNTFQTFNINETGAGALSFFPCDVLECYPHVLNPTGPGRWMLAPFGENTPVFQDGEVWVLWMDFDDRTVVIGDTLANYVWILDRNEAGGGDRISAAREILEWYGYDLNQLETVQ